MNHFNKHLQLFTQLVSGSTQLVNVFFLNILLKEQQIVYEASIRITLVLYVYHRFIMIQSLNFPTLFLPLSFLWFYIPAVLVSATHTDQDHYLVFPKNPD